MKKLTLLSLLLFLFSNLLSQDLKFGSIEFYGNKSLLASQPTKGTIQIDEAGDRIIVQTDEESTVYKILEAIRSDTETSYRVVSKNDATGAKRNSEIIYDSFFNLFKIINKVKNLEGIESYKLLMD